jgi:hypothetical protein
MGGLGQIEKYVEEGGLLVTLGSGSMLPLEAGVRGSTFIGRSAAESGRWIRFCCRSAADGARVRQCTRASDD